MSSNHERTDVQHPKTALLGHGAIGPEIIQVSWRLARGSQIDTVLAHNRKTAVMTPGSAVRFLQSTALGVIT